MSSGWTTIAASSACSRPSRAASSTVDQPVVEIEVVAFRPRHTGVFAGLQALHSELSCRQIL